MVPEMLVDVFYETPQAHQKCLLTLILVEFQFFLRFLEMLQFGTYVPEIK
jgi:hypothetical protein